MFLFVMMTSLMLDLQGGERRFFSATFCLHVHSILNTVTACFLSRKDIDAGPSAIELVGLIEIL